MMLRYSISDAETQSGNEHSPSDNEKDNDEVHEDTQTNNKEPDNDVEIEPPVDLDNPQPKNKRYDKRDFVARKHGKEREPWVQKPMAFPPKSTKNKDDEEFERFAETISDAETQSGNEHSPSDNEKDNDEVHEDTQTNNKEPDNDVEIEPPVDLDNPQPKNKRYDKRDFVARKHGKEREPWVQKPMAFPPKSTKNKDDEEFERFAEMLRP